MAWYNRLFTWVTDRDNGIPITASRMDAEFDGIATALNSLHGSVTSSSEWVAETSSVSYVAATQFQVIGVDATAIYHVGRRVKIVHNSGATTVYGTVSAVSYAADTLVTVITDDGSSLISSVTAVSYGSLSYTNPSYLDPRTQVVVQQSGDQSYLNASGFVDVQFSIENQDALSEFNTANYTFTARKAGFYHAAFQLAWQQTSGAANTNVRGIIVVSGNLGPAAWINDGVSRDSGAVFWMTATLLGYLAAGTTLKCQVASAQDGTIKQATTTPYTGSFFSVGRII